MIRPSLPPGGLVVEPFGGTMRAAHYVEGERVDGRYLTSESDPHYRAAAIASIAAAVAGATATACGGTPDRAA
jgi:hypothetical protein